MATSRAAVAAIWLAPPSRAAAQKAGVACGCSPRVRAKARPTNTAVNGRPNRNRTRVAPQGPVSPITERWAALRATWANEAAMVIGIQIMTVPYAALMRAGCLRMEALGLLGAHPGGRRVR